MVEKIEEMNNDINRIVNCETANIAKTVNTAIRQINMIEKIGIDNLPENLREIAKIRCENPEANLERRIGCFNAYYCNSTFFYGL